MSYLHAGTVASSGGQWILLISLVAGVASYAYDSTLNRVFDHVLSLSTLDAILYSTASAFGTAILYHRGCSFFENKYYQMLRDRPREWKVQQDRWLSKTLHDEEEYTGTRNAFVGGFLGVFLIVGTPNCLYSCVHEHSLLYHALSYPIFFLWVEFYAYWMHRLHHTRFIYKRIHKQHHRYVAPTPFSAYAMHPLEFVSFVVGPMSIIYMLPLHLVPVILNLFYIGFHAIVDHSGIDFRADIPFQAPVRFHDDHHRYFHANYGQSVMLFDWMFGTMYDSGAKKKEAIGDRDDSDSTRPSSLAR